ncbi:energy transducer TonB [Pseudomonas sp. LS1212]|uniref:energy transducer TonB n=1 Tax=Pseudomonas sp. LS1212 TaxID=2972478 RepID=UPI00215BBFDE|nr:energy transducer TonB [Pseudomonas sp. LS1212]UVJ44830.1 energy transducer TonB [Pseudomonas sp. LS1212]
MKHFWSYLLVSIALHLSVGWLLRDLRAEPEPLAWQPPMAIQLVSLAPVSQPVPAPRAQPEPELKQIEAPTPPKVPVTPKLEATQPKPHPVTTSPVIAKTPPPPQRRPESRPSQPARSTPATVQTDAQPAPAKTVSPTAPAVAAPAPSLTPMVSLRPSFVTPPPAPRYPSVARRRNQQGIVRVEVQLDERGQQQKLALTGSSGVASLDQAALDAVKNWRFRPEIVDGRAVPSRVEIPIEFALTANR